MRKHAKLAPSSAERWMNCTKSAMLEAKEPYTTSEAADKGTLAHSLSEHILGQKLHGLGSFKLNQEQLSKAVSELTRIQKHALYDADMLLNSHSYTDWVVEQYKEALVEDPSAKILLEIELNLTDYVPGGFGHADVIIISEFCLHCIDLKTGRNLVQAIANKQGMIYSLGALKKYDFLYSPDIVKISIYQPVINNVSTWQTTRVFLLSWGGETLIPIAKIAISGNGSLTAGPHCKYCKVAGKCSANAAYNLEMAKYEFSEAVYLSDDEIADIIEKADSFTDWLENVRTYATEQATKHAKKWPGLKLIRGRSDRSYTDAEAVELKLLGSQVKPSVIYKPKEIWGIGEMEKRLGPKMFAEYLSHLITKPDGKLKLVPLSHNKEEYNSLEKAQREFAEESEDINDII